MSEKNPLDWNEMLIITVCNGQTKGWRGWRKGVAAFNDPATWTSESDVGKYFKPYELKENWKPGDYGIAVVDMDAKKAWSISDWSCITSFYFLRPKATKDDEENAIRKKAIMNLLVEEKELKQCVLSFMGTDENSDFLEIEITLDELLKINGLADASKKQKLDFLSSHPDKLKVNLPTPLNEVMFARGRYQPEGWEVKDNIFTNKAIVFASMLSHVSKISSMPTPSYEELIEILSEQFMEAYEIEPNDFKNNSELFENDQKELEQFKERQNSILLIQKLAKEKGCSKPDFPPKEKRTFKLK